MNKWVYLQEGIDGDNNWDSELCPIADVFLEIW
jgi:hypothetical protein